MSKGYTIQQTILRAMASFFWENNPVICLICRIPTKINSKGNKNRKLRNETVKVLKENENFILYS